MFPFLVQRLLKLRVENQAAKELQILSWMILFPPFYLCALGIRIFLLTCEASHRLNAPVRLCIEVLLYLAAAVGLLAVGMCFGKLTKLLHLSKQPAVILFTVAGMSMFFFSFYCQIPGFITALLSLRRLRAVKLRDY